MEFWLKVLIIVIPIVSVFLCVIWYSFATSLDNNQETQGTGKIKYRPKKRKKYGFGYRPRKLRSNNCDIGMWMQVP